MRYNLLSTTMSTREVCQWQDNAHDTLNAHAMGGDVTQVNRRIAFYTIDSVCRVVPCPIYTSHRVEKSS